jgi:hypothetical protein
MQQATARKRGRPSEHSALYKRAKELVPGQPNCLRCLLCSDLSNNVFSYGYFFDHVRTKHGNPADNDAGVALGAEADDELDDGKRAPLLDVDTVAFTCTSISNLTLVRHQYLCSAVSSANIIIGVCYLH